MKETIENIHSYGYNARKQATVVTCNSYGELAALVCNATGDGSGISILGGRNSFGDVFIPAANRAVDVSGFDKILHFDAEQHTITVQCGVRAHTLSLWAMQHGYYLPATSGSPYNTIAGDISSNINGKDSWKYGNYYYNVVSLKLMTAAGDIMTVRKEDALFNAIAGGLGMLAIILEATLKLIPRKATAVETRRIVTRDLPGAIGVFKEIKEAETDFCYAWIDTTCAAGNLGRAIIETGRLTDKTVEGNTGYTPRTHIAGVPEDTFWYLIRNTWSILQKAGIDRPAMQLLNSLRYNSLKRETHNHIVALYEYQYPAMNAIPNWNKRFVKRGMQEIQCLFSIEVFETALRKVLSICNRHKLYPELCAIRKHKHDAAYLSFSGNGLSFTINYDRNNRSDEKLYRFEREVIAMVINYSGKIYLSKFPYISPEECKAMYPDMDKFTNSKKQIDPANIFATQASQRLLGL